MSSYEYTFLLVFQIENSTIVTFLQEKNGRPYCPCVKIE